MTRPLALLAFLVVTAAAAPAHAVPEVSLGARYSTEVLGFCLTRLGFGELGGARGVPLAYARFSVPAPRGALVIVPGRGDPMLKFCEVVYDLQDSGYDIYLLDHRGHGLSGRVIDDPYKVHVDDFDDFVDDLDAFLAEVVEPVGYARVVGLAHSMGGAIATLEAERRPGAFDALVLSAPMHAVGTLGVPEPIAYLLAANLTRLGLGREYAFSQGPPDPHASFASNEETHSEARWNARRTLDRVFPDFVRGTSTFRWLKEALEAARELRAHAGQLSVPTLVFQADDDAFVENWGQDLVCQAAPACERRLVTGAFHDLLLERDSLRDAVLAGVREVLETPSRTRPARPGSGDA